MAGTATNAGRLPPALDRRLTVYALLISAVYAGVLMLQASAVSFYTLDDAYIHMALAENIARGHFGVNLGEASNPSSSILWPWLLAGFEKIGLMLWAPLIINIASFVLALRILLAFAVERLAPDGRDPTNALIFAGLGFLSFNLFGLIFTGMEHSLHVLVSAAAVTRVIGKKYDWLTLVAVVLCPLMRFEGATIVVFALGAAIFDKRYVFGAAALVLVAAALGAYEFWLAQLGLPPLPSSVLAKSGISSGMVDTGAASLFRLVQNAGDNVHADNAHMFGLFGVALAWAAIRREGRDRILALGMLAVVALTFVFGRMDGYARYDVWILCAAGAATIHLMQAELRQVLAGRAAAVAMGAALVLMNAASGFTTLLTAPTAARNIDRQQHQMHRLVTECWKKPIAVNDLGWVSFRNDLYVLDLAGLGSEAARKARAAGGVKWMDELAAERNVEAAAIYREWFLDVPASWTRVGDLLLLDSKITPFSEVVAFYATRPEAVEPLRACLIQLAASLPSKAAIRLGAPR